eukprot:5996648-Ditylum_brightwellii.AAC.1
MSKQKEHLVSDEDDDVQDDTDNSDDDSVGNGDDDGADDSTDGAEKHLVHFAQDADWHQAEISEQKEHL